MRIAIAAACVLFASWCGLAGEPDDWSQEPPLAQADVDIYIETILSALLEAQQSPNTRDVVDRSMAAIAAAGIPRPRLAMVIVKMQAAHARLIGMENMAFLLDAGGHGSRLSDGELALVAESADRLEAVYAEAARRKAPPVPPELHGTDEGVIAGFLYFSIIHQGVPAPDLQLPLLLDIAGPERSAFWEEVLPAFDVFADVAERYADMDDAIVRGQVAGAMSNLLIHAMLKGDMPAVEKAADRLLETVRPHRDEAEKSYRELLMRLQGKDDQVSGAFRLMVLRDLQLMKKP